MNASNLVLLVEQALVGDEAIDQLVKFNAAHHLFENMPDIQ